MPSKQKKSTAAGETEEVGDEVEETELKIKESGGDDGGVTHGDAAKGEKSREKHKSAESSEDPEAPGREKKKKKTREKKKKKAPDDAAVIENEEEEGEQNNNDPKNNSKKEKSGKLKEEVTEVEKDKQKKKKKKTQSSTENPEGEEEMGSKDKKSKDGKKKKKSDGDEEPLIEEQEEEEDSKKKKKKKAKKVSADSDEDKKKKGKKSKNKQVDYGVIYQNELLNYNTDSSDGYEDEYYKKKGKGWTLQSRPGSPPLPPPHVVFQVSLRYLTHIFTSWSFPTGQVLNTVFPPVPSGRGSRSLRGANHVLRLFSGEKLSYVPHDWSRTEARQGARDKCWEPSQSPGLGGPAGGGARGRELSQQSTSLFFQTREQRGGRGPNPAWRRQIVPKGRDVKTPTNANLHSLR